MKIKTINITTVAAKPPKTQAHVSHYDVDYNNSLYSMRHTVNASYVPSIVSPILNVVCSCPQCGTEFRILARAWASNQDMEMNCVCGLALLIMPAQQNEYERSRYI